jgi:lipocalin
MMKGFALTHLLLTLLLIIGCQTMKPIHTVDYEYRVIFLSEDYSKTVIGRSKRDYVWIMAREPAISDEEYTAIVNFLQKEGYDVKNLQKVQHGKGQEIQ